MRLCVGVNHDAIAGRGPCKRAALAHSDFCACHRGQPAKHNTSAAAVADALATPTGETSASGTAGTTAGPARLGGGYEPAHVDKRVNHLAGGTPGPAVSTRKTGT